MFRRIRRIIERVATLSGTRAGRRLIRWLSYSRDGRVMAVPFSSISESSDLKILDQNIPLEDSYCPICDSTSDILTRSDYVNSVSDVSSRKILYECGKCNFLFTNEKRWDRADYFTETPYRDDKSGARWRREDDLTRIALELLRPISSPKILVYGVGQSTAVSWLHSQGFSEVWGADVADSVEYDEKTINLATDPEYFARQEILFDVIIAVEVLEHIDRSSIANSFQWIAKNLNERGLMLATTSLWFPSASDAEFCNRFEYGDGVLQWWRYPHFIDHTSFFTITNLKSVFNRFGCNVETAYFSGFHVHFNDPAKRIVAVYKTDNEPLQQRIRAEFAGKFFDVFYY